MVVMVVEDSATMRQLICHALRKIEGCEIVEAGDGADALAKLATKKPDVIVTDINMPQLDGFGLLRELRARKEYEQLPVIVLTTAGSLDDQERAKGLAVTGYVTKPVKPDVVVAAVRDALAKRA